MMSMRTLSIFLLTLMSASIAHAQATGNEGAPSFRQRYEAIARNVERLDDSTRLQRLFETNWEYLMNEYPEFGGRFFAAVVIAGEAVFDDAPFESIDAGFQR